MNIKSYAINYLTAYMWYTIAIPYAISSFLRKAENGSFVMYLSFAIVVLGWYFMGWVSRKIPEPKSEIGYDFWIELVENAFLAMACFGALVLVIGLEKLLWQLLLLICITMINSLFQYGIHYQLNKNKVE